MANYPSTPLTTGLLHTAVNNLETVLDGDITDIQTTIDVLSTVNFPSTGAITIDAERIAYTGTTATSFTGCTRGFGGTAAVIHFDGSTVEFTYGAEFHNDLRDEIIAIGNDLETKLGTTLGRNLAPDGSVGSPSWSFASDTDTGLYKFGTNSLGFSTNSLARMVIDSSGFVGIGATAPNTRLTVGSYVSTVGDLLAQAKIISDTLTAGSEETTLEITQMGTSISSAVGLCAGVISGSNPYFSIKTRPNAGGTSVERMRIDGLGNVGIGGIPRALLNPIETSAGAETIPLTLTNSSTSANTAVGIDFNLSTIDFTNSKIVATRGASSLTDLSLYTWGPSSLSEKLRITSNGQLLGIDGTAALPSISFLSDADTGITRIANNSVSLITQGVENFRVNGGGQALLATGSATVPSLSFLSDPDTGIYSYAANQFGISIAGALQFLITSLGVDLAAGQFIAPIGTVGAPSYTFAGDSNTGLYHPTADQLSFVCGGIGYWHIDGNGRIYTDNNANTGAGLGKFLGSFTGAQNCDFQVNAGNSECGTLFVLFQNNSVGVNAFKFDTWSIGCNSNGTLHSNSRSLIDSNSGGSGTLPTYTFTEVSGTTVKTLRITPTGNITNYVVYYLKIR